MVEFMSQEEVAGPARTAVILRRQVELLLDPEPGSETVDIAELDKKWDGAQKSLSTAPHRVGQLVQTQSSTRGLVRREAARDSVVWPVSSLASRPRLMPRR
jgi:hypothetical protein